MVTYARDALIEEVWKTVRDDIVYVPLHQQVIVWAMRDQLELPVDPWNLPRFRLARLNPMQPGTAQRPERRNPGRTGGAQGDDRPLRWRQHRVGSGCRAPLPWRQEATRLPRLSGAGGMTPGRRAQLGASRIRREASRVLALQPSGDVQCRPRVKTAAGPCSIAAAGCSGRRGEGPMRIGSLAAAMLLSVCSWQAAAQNVGVADLQDFTLKNGQDLADLCGAEPGDEIYAEAKQFCYGFLSGVVHFHDALATGPNGHRIVCPEGKVTRAGRRRHRRRLGDGSPGPSQHDRSRRSRGQGGTGQVGAVSEVSAWSRHRGHAKPQPNGRTLMRRLMLPLALVAALTLGACQSTDADTTMRTAGGAGIGAAGGAIIGAFTGSPGTGAAVGAALGGASGFLYDQYGRSSFAK